MCVCVIVCVYYMRLCMYVYMYTYILDRRIDNSGSEPVPAYVHTNIPKASRGGFDAGQKRPTIKQKRPTEGLMQGNPIFRRIEKQRVSGFGVQV